MFPRRVCAYITAYMDLFSINTLINQVYMQTFKCSQILIVDNSPLQLQIYSSSNIVILNYPINIGVAGGLNLAIKWAINNNFDFLWAFDQDSLPSTDNLDLLISEYNYLHQNNVPVGIISPTIFDNQTQSELPNGYLLDYKFKWKLPHNAHYYRDQLYRCDAVITSGSLINLQAAKHSLPPNSDLFIDGVDWDYCLKLRQSGYHICVSQRATMQHNFGTYLKTIGKLTPIYIYSPLRYYYINRNHTYIETRLLSNPFYIFLSILHRFKTLIYKLIKIIVFEPDQKLLKIWASCLGFIHGLIGKLGKTWTS